MADWIKAQSDPTERQKLLEAGRAEVEATLQRHHELKHRAIDETYNLLQVSAQRWRLIRIGRYYEVGGVNEPIEPVLMFEFAGQPVKWEVAVKALQEAREKRRRG